MWDREAWKQVPHHQERRRVFREGFQGAGAPRMWPLKPVTRPLIKEVEEEGTERLAESRPGEPTSGATHKEHELHMYMGSMGDSAGFSDSILFCI